MFKFILISLSIHGILQITECNGLNHKIEYTSECINDIDCQVNDTICVKNQCQCKEGYTYSGDKTKCVRIATHYGDQCSEDLQCSSYLSAGGACNNGLCGCATGYHYLHGYCFKSSGLGEECQSSNQCYLDNDPAAVSCKNNECHCSDNFYQREHRTCRRAGRKVGDECTIDHDCKLNGTAICDKSRGCQLQEAVQTLSDKKISSNGKHIVNVRTIGNSCNSNAECKASSSTCSPLGICVCTRAYFPSANMDECIPELGEPCTNSETPRIKYALCRDGVWSCKNAYVATIDNRSCRKVTTKYNFSCLMNEQCLIFGPDAFCKDKKSCLCNDNSHYVENQLYCWMNRGLGDFCIEDEDCYIKDTDINLNCNDKSICACPKGAHSSSDNSTCLKDDNPLGGACLTDEYCTRNNSVCSENSCVCGKHYYENEGECYPGISAECRGEDDCNFVNASCKNSTCTCDDNFVEYRPNICIPVGSYGAPCTSSVQCQRDGTICVDLENNENEKLRNGTCLCPKGHHYKWNFCYATKVLKDSCANNGECYSDSEANSVICKNGQCSCNFGWKAINSTYCKGGATITSISNYAWLLLFTLSILRLIHHDSL